MYKILHIPTGNFIIYFSSAYDHHTIKEIIELNREGHISFFLSEAYLNGRDAEYSHEVFTDYKTANIILHSNKMLRDIAADINDITDSSSPLDELIKQHGIQKIIPCISEFELVEIDT